MNPRQRRGALLMIVALVGALAVVGAVAAYVSDIQEQVGPTQTVLRLATDIEQFTPIGVDQVEAVEVPERWAPERALRAPEELAGAVATTSMPAGTVLQQGAVREPPEIASGEREIAILVSPETGVGGKIQAGDRVDIYATYAGEPAEQRPPRSELVLQNVQIVDIEPAIEASADDLSGFAANQVVPVTFAVSAQDALVLAYAESFATEVRLGLRTPIDTGDVPPGQRSYAHPAGG